MNTLSRSRRRKQEAEELAAEARQAMEDPLLPAPLDLGTDGYQLAEGEERSMIEPQSKVSHTMHECRNLFLFIYYLMLFVLLIYLPFEIRYAEKMTLAE